MQLRTRIAPTPSGFLHLGNAFSFVLTWLYARRASGKVILRIDDLDSARKRPEYVADIFESLDWLGIEYDEGPSGPDDFEATLSQRHRVPHYVAQLEKLRASQQLFGCVCSRSSIQRESQDGRHPPSCRQRATNLAAPNVAWRVETTTKPVTWQDHDTTHRSVCLNDEMRDFVVRRKDGLPAYQVASLCDDIDLDINFIVRGIDLLHSTAAQRSLATKLNLNRFLDASFLHHPLVPSPTGEKLSKSAGSSSLRAMREANASPDKIYQQLSPMLGLPETVSSAEEALAAWKAQ